RAAACITILARRPCRPTATRDRVVDHLAWAWSSCLTPGELCCGAMTGEHEAWMRLAIEEAELARGTTGDNPWVGCAIVSPDGKLRGRGHTLGPGEDHAEIAAARDAQALGHGVAGATLYSTLEPCSFHGRTPACSRSIAERRIARVVIGMRDPHP